MVVGGGTAGCVLANRLSANGKYTVLLLEAGGTPPEFLDIPGLAKENELLPEYTFQYRSSPQINANSEKYRISVGRVLGGTSQINYMLVNRASPYDYDNWANLTGDGSWAYQKILPFFKRSEIYFGQFPDKRQHGFEGPVPVSYQEYAPGNREWLEAAKEMGYSVRDSNGPQMISFAPAEFAKYKGRRISAYQGYLKPVMGKRKNLKVITRAFVRKVVNSLKKDKFL